MSDSETLNTRTISVDPGLLSPEELLKSHKDGRRKTLEAIIAKRNCASLSEAESRHFRQKCREYINWFLDSAKLKISVSSMNQTCNERLETKHSQGHISTFAVV